MTTSSNINDTNTATTAAIREYLLRQGDDFSNNIRGIAEADMAGWSAASTNDEVHSGALSGQTYKNTTITLIQSGFGIRVNNCTANTFLRIHYVTRVEIQNSSLALDLLVRKSNTTGIVLESTGTLSPGSNQLISFSSGFYMPYSGSFDIRLKKGAGYGTGNADAIMWTGYSQSNRYIRVYEYGLNLAPVLPTT